MENKIESIDITLTPGELEIKRDNGELRNKLVVVIDVLRATSVMITALQNGASGIIPTSTIEHAFKIKNKLKEKAMLCGERGGKILPGFCIGTSLCEYKEEIVKNKIIILTTSHGTQTVESANGAKEIIIASCLNASAVGNYLKEKGGDILLAASGSICMNENTKEKREHCGGKEDVVIGCGFVLQGLLKDYPEIKKFWIKNLEKVSERYLLSGPQKIEDSLLKSRWGKQMLKFDIEEQTNCRKLDIEWIAKNTNKINIVPVMGDDGIIRIKNLQFF
ncbi:MAG: 2-phosphosulfolactate phosphatase [Candidatus Paceibacterota bacterium]